MDTTGVKMKEGNPGESDFRWRLKTELCQTASMPTSYSSVLFCKHPIMRRKGFNSLYRHGHSVYSYLEPFSAPKDGHTHTHIHKPAKSLSAKMNIGKDETAVETQATPPDAHLQRATIRPRCSWWKTFMFKPPVGITVKQYPTTDPVHVLYAQWEYSIKPLYALGPQTQVCHYIINVSLCFLFFSS